MVEWAMVIFLMAVVGFAVFVVTWLWIESERFPLVYILIGFGIGLIVWGGGAMIFGLHVPPEPEIVHEAAPRAAPQQAQSQVQKRAQSPNEVGTIPTIPEQSGQLKSMSQDSETARRDSERANQDSRPKSQGSGALKTSKESAGQDSEPSKQDSREASQDSKPKEQDSLTLRERVLRAGLSDGTLGVATLWRRFRNDNSVTKAELEQVLADLEGKKWTAPDGVQYKVTKADYERRKGRELIRI